MWPNIRLLSSNRSVSIICCPWQRFCIFVLLLVSCISKSFARFSDPDCKACKEFVETFQKGYDKTANLNFGGGNTEWEETRLGSYSTSETRLVEILEHVCTEGAEKDLCHQFAERQEEQVEKWYFHLQKNDPDFEKWLCISTAKVCCPPNSFGVECNACPSSSGVICTSRGECEGAGTRKGSGKCRCQKGYRGDVCDSCSSGFQQMEKNDSFIECRDMDECELDPNICPQNEYCYNTEGAYKCSKCHAACRGCTGAGAGKCKACGEGYVLTNGTCTDELEVAKMFMANKAEADELGSSLEGSPGHQGSSNGDAPVSPSPALNPNVHSEL